MRRQIASNRAGLPLRQTSFRSKINMLCNKNVEDRASHEAPLLNKESLRIKLGLPSTRSIDELVKRRKIPRIVMGHRMVRFCLADVLAALDRLTIKEIQ